MEPNSGQDLKNRVELPSMKFFVFILTLLLTSPLFPHSFKEAIAQGKPGDYIVTAQGKMYTVLLLRSISQESFTIEEISIPESEIESSKMSWKSWVETFAPAHTSWTAYEIDLKDNHILESFSYDYHAWLYADESQNFLSTLLSLPLKRTPVSKRKKIGPSPLQGEEDRRKIWQPPVVIEGKTKEKTTSHAWTTQWPSDDTLISECEIDFYFDNFPFPYWIEIHSPHYTLAIRAVDSGHNLKSPQPLLPHKPPEFLGQAYWSKEKLSLRLKCPKYYSKLNLFVIDLSEEIAAPIALDCLCKREREFLTLEVSQKTLEKKLKKGHRYQWVVIPENSTEVFAESESSFEF